MQRTEVGGDQVVMLRVSISNKRHGYYLSSDPLWLKKVVDGKQSICPRSQALDGSCNSDCLERCLAKVFPVKGKYFKPDGHESMFHILLDLFACFYN